MVVAAPAGLVPALGLALTGVPIFSKEGHGTGSAPRMMIRLE